MVSNRPSLDCLRHEAVGENNDNGSCLVKDHVDNAVSDDVKQKNLFYHLLKVYLELNCSRGIVQPVSAWLGDAQLLDLYKLFSLVKKRGGYVVVSRKGSWGFVTKELGLDLQVLASVKLAYVKYLNDFEAWLKKTFEDKFFRNGNHACGWGFRTLPLEIEKELRALLCPNLKEKDDELDLKQKGGELDEKEKDDEFVELESKKIRKCIGSVNHKNETNLLDTKNQNNYCKDVLNVHGDDDEKLCNSDKDGHATLDKEDAEKEFNNRKRKREALSGMLNWMKHIAKHPLIPVKSPIPKPSKWKEYKGQDCFFQVLRAREVLFLKHCVEPKRGPAYFQVCREKKVSVGPCHQAPVPEWTGLASDSDSKWIATQIWRPLEHDSKPAPETDPIGRVRDNCCCEVPGSVNCHRLHIAENRMKLKLELGPFFYHWGFDRMGEEVSLQWTTEEENRFKNLMRSHAPIWTNPSRYFPGKRRRNLVNYYFNEFVIQLRSYQNRATPNSVDSDDDEAEFQSFGHFGMEALWVVPVNKQCMIMSSRQNWIQNRLG